MIKNIPLTASQISFLDELHFDKLANENLLKQAFTYYSNRENEIEKRRHYFFEEIHKAHNLGEEIVLCVNKVDGRLVVEEVPKDEKKEENNERIQK